MDGSEEESNWGRSSNSRGFNLNAPSYLAPSSPGFALPLRANTPPTSSPRQVLEVERERLHLWEGGGGPAALPRRGGDKRSKGEGDVSLRAWLDNPSRTVELVECLHIFRQIADMVSVAHAQGVVVKNVRPSCLVLSALNHVSFVESTSSGMGMVMGMGTGSGSGSGSAADSSEEQGKGCSLRPGFALEADSSWGGEGERTVREIGERTRALPLKQILMLESNWYMSPEDAAGGEISFASDVYRLGVLLFELFCGCSSPEEKLRTMSNLRHRVLPPQLLLKWPKEASFCLWLLHPIPGTRPKMSEVLKSDFLVGPKDSMEEHATAIKLQEEIEDEDLLLEFLMHLKERKQETADRLHDVICCLSSDIEEVMKKQSNLREKVGPLQEFDHGDHSGLERVDLSMERIKDSVSYGSRKRPRPQQQSCSGSEADEHVPGGLGLDVRSTLKETILLKSCRLMKNFKKLESAYFMMRCRTTKPVGKFQNRNLPSGSLGRGSVVWTEGSSVGNSIPKESTGLGGKGKWINPFLEGLCKYLTFSKLNARADLKQGDLLSSSNLVCSLAFDRDKDLFATAGVNRKIKVFECDAILGEDQDIHYPVVEMSGRSKFSSICWNGYIKSQIASSDFEGIVQVWDATRSEVIAQMREHEKRVWCVDFSLANPTKLASGSDDGTVKLWSINQFGSIGTIKTKANVCSVQFRPDSGHFVAIGSADHRVYCYDLRNLRTPWCTLIGHLKTVSYIKFVDSSTLVSASTDNTMKLWDLSSGVSAVLDDPFQTFTGHTNIKNFVGLSISDGYIATGSETNEVFVYHKAFPMPMLSFRFDSTDPLSGQGVDDTVQFVSCVCWRGQSNTLVAANSSGNIKLLEMV